MRKREKKLILLAKTKLNIIETLVHLVLNDWNVSHDEFVSLNNVLKEYDFMKEGTKIWVLI